MFELLAAVHFHRSMYHFAYLKTFMHTLSSNGLIDGLLSSMQMLRKTSQKLLKVGNLLTNTSDSFTNFASTNLPIIFYKNEYCYLH